MQFLPKMFIGDARDGIERIGDGLQEFPVFPGDIQRANSPAVLNTGPRDLAQHLSHRSVIPEGGHLLREAVDDIGSHLGAHRDIRNAFAQGHAFLGTGALPTFRATEDPEHAGIVHGHFSPQDIVFVVEFGTVLIHPVADANAFVPDIGAREDFGIGRGFAARRRPWSPVSWRLGRDDGLPHGRGTGRGAARL